MAWRSTKALADGDIEAVRQVGRRFFHTQAGYKACFLTARHELDQNRPLAAALHFKRLREASGGGEFEPELTILYAVSLLNSGQHEAAKEILTELQQQSATMEVQVAGQPAQIPENAEELRAWLTKFAPARSDALEIAQIDWRTTRGNIQRNGIVDGGMPLPDEEYWIDSVIYDEDRKQVQLFQSDRRAQLSVALPALQPLAIGNLLMLRTPMLTFGYDLTTGKPIWVMPWNRAEDMAPSSRDETNVAAYFMKQRIWDDLAYGQMSSDGKALFSLIAAPDINEPGGGTGIPQAQLQAMMFGNATMLRDSYNHLVALDVVSEGKYLWMLGGPSSDDPKLSGAYFLGPPLVLDDELYVIAELKDEIKLLVLDAHSGKLIWSQQLAQVEAPFAYDMSRRLAGCVPSYADGVLVCPTASGVLVAVDLATRSLLWGYSYRYQSTKSQNAAMQRRFRSNWSFKSETWSDNVAIVANGCVVMTPIASDRLHCLSLLTGEELWRPKQRDEGLHVAGVANERIVLVKSHGVEAIELASGRTAWHSELPERVSPSGRGFISQNSLFLPTDDAAIVKLSLDDGQLMERVPMKNVLGNLVCHAGYLVSQAADAIRVFRLRDQTRASVLQRLAINDDDTDALQDQVAIHISDGQQDAALQVLDRLVSLIGDPSEVTRLQRQKVQLVLKLLENDFEKYQGYVADIDSLIDDRGDRIRLSEMQANRLFEQDQRKDAFDGYLRLVDSVISNPVFEFEPGASPELISVEPQTWSVARTRWFSMRLANILRNASADERSAMLDQIQERLERAFDTSDWAALQDLVNFFPNVDPVLDARLRLSRHLMADGKQLAAEIQLVECAKSKSHQGQASAIQALLLSRYGTPGESVPVYRRLVRDFSKKPVLDGLTPEQLAESIPSLAADLKSQDERNGWPSGKAIVIEDATELSRVSQNTREITIVGSTELWPSDYRLKIDLEARSNELLVLDGSGVPVVRTPVDANLFTRTAMNSHAAHAFGHLLLVSLGNNILAIDTISEVQSGPERLLWTSDPQQSSLPAMPYRGETFNIQKTIPIPIFNGETLMRATMGGHVVGRFGPVSQHGVCYVENDDLVCVDLFTGQRRWVRPSIGEKMELFGDAEHVFVASIEGRNAKVYSAETGEFVGEREIPHPDRRWKTFGRYVLTWETLRMFNTPVNFRLFDCWTGEDVWSKELAPNSRGCLVGNDQLAVLSPDGKFEIWNIDDGLSVLSDTLPYKADSTTTIDVVRSEAQYLLVINQRKDAQREQLRNANLTLRAPRIDGELPLQVSGPMYAFDRATGARMWKQPLQVNDYFLPKNQPLDSPVLTLLRTLVQQTRGRGNSIKSSVVCLDKRTGDLLYSDHTIRRNLDTFFVRGDLETKSVTIQTGNDHTDESSVVTIQITDQPRPEPAGNPLPPIDFGGEQEKEKE